MNTIAEFHAHIYFDPAQLDAAKEFAHEAKARFGGIRIGNFHEKPVGPHPRGSCQLTVPVGDFGSFAIWAPLARRDLTIFAHAETGDVIADHTRHVVWFGPSETLDMAPLHRAAKAAASEAER